MASQVELNPAERRRKRVRDAILDAAERVFAQEGEDGLSIRRLADEIDYSPAAIYKYFGSKDELIEELKEAFFERILAQVDEVENSTRSPGERMRRSIITYVRTALEKPRHYAAAFTGESRLAELRGPEGAGCAALPKKAQAFSVLLGVVEDGLRSGDFRGELDALAAAKSVWASSHGVAMLMAHFPDFPRMWLDDVETDRDGFITLHADLIARGLEK